MKKQGGNETEMRTSFFAAPGEEIRVPGTGKEMREERESAREREL